MAEQKATNIVWHQGAVTRADRERLSGHRSATIWFTGLSGSGKSTIAVALEKALWERGVHAFVLDGDNVRHGLNKNLGISPPYEPPLHPEITLRTDAQDIEESVRQVLADLGQRGIVPAADDGATSV